MPQKKMIDRELIPLKNLDQLIIEAKDCLQVNLVFNEPFTEKQGNIIRSQYKCVLDNENINLSRKINNSWKGLIMLFLSLSFCKYGNGAFTKILDAPYLLKHIRHLPFVLDFDYGAFLDYHEQLDISSEAQPTMSKQELWDWAKKNDAYKKRKENYPKMVENNIKRLYAKREPDPTFENVIVPDYCRPFYIRGRYETADIETCLLIFAKVLGLDEKKSSIGTIYSTDLPHSYTSRPAVYKDDTSYS